jgi:hypothetical protein
VKGGSTEPHTPIIVWNDGGQINQKWNTSGVGGFVPLPHPVPGPGPVIQAPLGYPSNPDIGTHFSSVDSILGNQIRLCLVVSECSFFFKNVQIK